jgi:hypothetical protein
VRPYNGDDVSIYQTKPIISDILFVLYELNPKREDCRRFRVLRSWRGDVLRKKQQRTEDQIEDSLRMRAEKKVRNKTGLLWLLYNVGSYVLINAALITIWILSDSDYPWFLWVMVVWAGGLAFHFAGYIVGFRYGASREHMIEEQMEIFRKKKGMTPVPGPEPAAAPPEPAAGSEPTQGE